MSSKNNSNSNNKLNSYKQLNMRNFYKNKIKNRTINTGDNDKIKEQIQSSINKAMQKVKNEKARQAIRTGLNAVAPGTGEIANKILDTEKGNELVDKYLEAGGNTEGLRAVAKEVKKDVKKKLYILGFLGFFLLFLLLIILVVIIFKNADSQIYSNENNGKVDTEEYPDNDLINPNIFNKYPGIYQKIEEAAAKVSNKYKVDIDKYLILATLIAPIENGNIVPMYDNSCGEDECYFFNNTSYIWAEFLFLLGD